MNSALYHYILSDYQDKFNIYTSKIEAARLNANQK